MKKKVICPGSFDPITVGHEDIILKAAELFDEVIVLVTNNSEKKYLFNASERFEMVRLAFENKSNIKVVLHDGLLGDYCIQNNIDVIVKGVRNNIDFDYEYQLSEINRRLANCDTVFFPAKNENIYISSAFVRELIKYNKDYSLYIPKNSVIFIKKNYKNN